MNLKFKIDIVFKWLIIGIIIAIPGFFLGESVEWVGSARAFIGTIFTGVGLIISVIMIMVAIIRDFENEETKEENDKPTL